MSNRMSNRVSLLLPCLFCVSLVMAQEKGFLFTYVDANHSWFARDAMETDVGNIIIGAKDDWGNEARLLKLSPDGRLLTELPIIARDTAVLISRLLYMPNENYGDYVAFCPCHPLDGSKAALLFIRFDSDLNVLIRKVVSCPFVEFGDRFFDGKVVTKGDTIVATFTIEQEIGPWGPTFLTLINKDGDFIYYQRCDRISTVCNLFCYDDDGIRIGLFGKLPGNEHRMGILTFDEALSLLSCDTLSQWQAPEGSNGDFINYSIVDFINSQTLPLLDATIVVSAKLSETLCHQNGAPSNNDDCSTVLAKFNTNEDVPIRWLITEHMNDSIEEPAFFRSVDVRQNDDSGCVIFQSVNLNIHPQMGPLQPYPTGIVVTKTDQDLNVEWKKRFLRDRNYQAMTINATADGGCLVVGSIGDHQAQRFDVFALKINADGTVGLDEIQEESMTFVYPNPAREAINIGGVEAEETVVYNTLGQRVMNFRGNEANVEALDGGVYLLRVTDIDNKTQTMRVVLDK